MLGSLTMRSAPNFRNYGDGSGCALGMAENAMGGESAESVHEWLNVDATVGPCGCKLPYFATLTTCIAHTFNEHVHGDKTWTLERLVDWVRSVEPNEPEECPAQQPSSVEAGLTTAEHATK